MSKTVQFKRGNANVSATYTGAQGEITVNTDDYSLSVHDGQTPGGYVILSSDTSSILGNIEISNQTISGLIQNANIILNPNGAGSVQVDSSIFSSGNVTANYLFANLAFATGINSNYGDSNVTALLAELNNNSIITNATVSAGVFSIPNQIEISQGLSNYANIISLNNRDLAITATDGVSASTIYLWANNQRMSFNTVSNSFDFNFNGQLSATDFTASKNSPVGYSFYSEGQPYSGFSHIAGPPDYIRIMHEGIDYARFYSNYTMTLTGNLVISSEANLFGVFPDAFLQVYSNVNSYSQLVKQNKNSGALASTDIVMTADNGSDSTYYLNMGTSGSNHDDSAFFGDTNSNNDSYLYTVAYDQAGPSLGNVGNLIIGSTNGILKFFVGNTAEANVIAKITSNALLPGSNVTYSLGSTDAQWKELWVSNNTIYIGGVPLSIDASGNFTINGNPISSSSVLPYLELTNDPFIFDPFVGEQVIFTKEDYATGEAATDYIDTSIAITRGNNQGIYNPILETQWDDNDNDGTSPVGTLWNTDGWDDLTNLTTRNYYSFYDAYLGRIGNNILSSEAIMKDVANNKYYKFEFTVWGQSSQGAPVTYTRTEIDPVTGEAIGEPILFEKAGYADPTQVNDPVDEGVTLARGNNQGLFNIAQEPEWNDQGDGEDSPEGTLWNADGWGRLNNVKNRTYVPFKEALDYAIGENILGTELVMWDTINDKYYAFKFSSWTRNNEGGGFAYTRQLVNTSQLFVKTDYGSEVDEISEGLHITRGEQGWLYNPLEDDGYDDDTPTGSVWNNDGWDDLSDVETRTYVPLETIWGGNFNNIPGAKMVMRDETTGKYWAIQFLTWTQGQNGGGFSYDRYELDTDQLQEGVKFADGSVLKSAEGIGRVKLTAPGRRRIEEVAGYKSVTVTERVTQASVSATSWDQRINSRYIYITWDADLYEYFNGDTYYQLEISLDNNTWYAAEEDGWSTNNYLGIELLNDRRITVNQGDTIYYRVSTGGEPQVWWDKNDLPGGGSNFRGAVIDYHAYTGDATFIGTIHIVDDNGEEHITHTEVSSGSDDSENDDLWFVQDDREGTISYRRIDGDSNRLRIQWTAKVFYGSEYYD
jgi:hypothetical protein